MSQGLITHATLEDIADAIREKLNTDDTYTPAQMADAVMQIPTGSVPAYLLPVSSVGADIGRQGATSEFFITGKSNTSNMRYAASISGVDCYAFYYESWTSDGKNQYAIVPVTGNKIYRADYNNRYLAEFSTNKSYEGLYYEPSNLSSATLVNESIPRYATLNEGLAALKAYLGG